MNISQRLLLTFSMLFGAIILQAVLAISLLSGFQERFEYVQTNAIPSIKDLNTLIDRSNQLALTLYKHQTQLQDSNMPAVEADIDKQIGGLKSLTDYYMKHDISSEEDKRLTEVAFSNIQRVTERLPAFLSASRAHQNAISLDLIEGQSGIGAAIRQLIADYQKQLMLNIAIGDELRATNRSTFHNVLWTTISGVVATVLVFGLFALFTVLRIRRSLADVGKVMMRASENLDLTLSADESRRDEVGNMARSFNQLMRSVAGSLSAVRSASHSVSSASVQIAAGNEDLSARTEQQAASLEQTAASMTELSETVRQTADNTRQASQLAANASSLSEKSGTSLSTMLSTMDDIRGSSRKVTDIVSMIEGIAFQTNILALNAAVEAARAGEHGKGFAVVAGEVRSLSQRSTSAAREIKGLIEESHRLTEAGAAQASDVSSNMQVMNDAIHQVSELMSEIAAAAVEQSQGISQVQQAVNQMDDVTQQNAALVEQASAASQSLQEQAQTLNQLVTRFVLAESGATPVIKPAPASHKAPQPGRLALASDADWQSF
ncbi:methyl-accepting chemotaxis protein [Pantoea dispersa]|uniref:methyl-accepting chemotaxis protein n=1 Tax=Pantoea TaxID=53335 RepID=UPI001BFF0791|nr:MULTISPECIES: methyl-accepting chemotaxis protein [Pantoea]MBU6519529.1 MCP four helix bundle domain-containing protein [Pantoea sp. B270]MCT6589754.1 methyl-accepting chemotaxis protein [Pantoea dispersa]UYP75846.1 methyl-accepting chemotaxis protein [Pantoea dispersa]